jgi:hypothetical protein
MKFYRSGIAMALAMGAMTASSSRALAVSYASNITKSGTTVNFILNSPADVLSYSINGGAPILLDGTTKGAKTFNLTNASDTFSISAARNDAVGFTIPTGELKGTAGTGWGSGLSQQTALAGLNILSDDSNILNRFNSPRGIDVSNNPNAPNFGTVYISNSVTGSVPEALPAPARTLVDEGLYALRADQSDAFGYGDVGKNPTASDGFPAFSTASTNSPFRVFVSDAGDVFVADYSDANGNVFAVNADFTAAQIMLAGIGGPGWDNQTRDPVTGELVNTAPFPDQTAIPPGQNHGSISGIHVEGSFAQGNLVLYAVDEDINSAHFGGTETEDRNSIWKWEIGGLPDANGSNVTPTKIGGGMIGWFAPGGILIDMEKGKDGKFYLSQNRSVGNEVGIQVISPDGTELFNSLTETRALLGNDTAVDIFRQVFEIAVSPDQKWLAAIVNVGDVVVMPLNDGIPDLAARMVVDTLPDVNSARGITFDAAGNIHYVSSGQQLYRVLAPGGHHVATTSWNGTEYAFSVETIGGGLDGDFNGDNVVDGADFLAWQRGDSPNNGSPADLTTWKNNFGTSAAAAAAAAVPEPATLALAGMGVAAVAAARRRRS